jgi:hypothetical protein
LLVGGGVNPPHLGHVAAAQDALQQARAAGYNVDGIMVAPTSDKLLAKKLPVADRVPVDVRARMAEQTFGKSIDGVPVEVSTEPAAQAEAKQGKPRRTDLADWAGLPVQAAPPARAGWAAPKASARSPEPAPARRHRNPARLRLHPASGMISRGRLP